MPKIRYTTLREDYPEEAVDKYGDPFRTQGQFKATVHETLEKISYELDKIDVSEGIIELDVSRSELRKYGRDFPRFAEPWSPRVRLTFSHPELGPLQYPCGTYWDQSHNLRAIALTLEAQRAIERYGATSGGQQYAGWQALPPGEEQDVYLRDAFEAAEFIGGLAQVATPAPITEDRDYYLFCYKKAAKVAHPDAGGSEEKFKTLQQAKELLDEHFEEEEAAVA